MITKLLDFLVNRYIKVQEQNLIAIPDVSLDSSEIKFNTSVPSRIPVISYKSERGSIKQRINVALQVHYETVVYTYKTKLIAVAVAAALVKSLAS